jgi:AraC-like DNA-binding protein
LLYFEKEKPYLNPELSMSLLSEKLNIPKHHLTEVLNGNLGRNFFRFVNEYRVHEVQKSLSNPKNPYSIEAIGFESGFNSKSTFFSVFKRITGLTPKEYKERCNG